MNPGLLKERISIMDYVLKDEIYQWVKVFESNSKVEREFKRKIFSKFGFGTDETTKFTVRFNNKIDAKKAILYRNNHYLLSSEDNVDNRNRFQEITTVKIEPKLFEAKRNIINKDELNRPVQELKIIYKFYCYLLEKYVGYSQEKINNTTTETFVLITPKIINLKVGDIVTFNDINYNVEVTHILDEDTNEYEIVVKKDV